MNKMRFSRIRINEVTYKNLFAKSGPFYFFPAISFDLLRLLNRLKFRIFKRQLNLRNVILTS